MALSATIKVLQDIMRKDVGVDGDAQRIGQLVWLVFLKIWDDREQELELLVDDYRSPLTRVTWQDGDQLRTVPDLRWRAWAGDPEGLTGDALLDFVNGTLFPALKGLLDTTPRGLIVRSVFEDAYQYMKSGTLLRQVINKISTEIDFNNSRQRHVFGELYEHMLRDLQNAGNAGEYYTPRAVTQFAVEMTDPKLGEVVLDPACGTGGFLTHALERVRAREVRRPEDESVLQRSVRGVEKKPLPHLLCVTNMVIHGIDAPTGIRRDNALARPIRQLSSSDRVDVIVTNPPFGGIEEDGIESAFPTQFRTRETADLFLVLITELLKPGGRAAVVLPDGSLSGEGVGQRIRRNLLEQCRVHTVVRLPAGVFKPYTPIPTNILFLEKGAPTEEVWYFQHPYPPGMTTYSKTRPIRPQEFDLERAWWHDRVEDEHAWRVPVEQIVEGGYNLDQRRGVTAAELDPPDVIAGRVLARLDALRDLVAGR